MPSGRQDSGNMKIETITIFKCERPFSRAFASSKRKRTRAEAIVLKIDCERGLFGYGECTPRPYVTGERIESVFAVIRTIMAEQLLGESFSSLPDIAMVLEGLSRTCETRYGRPVNSALCAVELALIDALGKQCNAPAQNLLGPALREQLPYALSIPLLSLPTLRNLLPLLDTVPFSSLKIVAGIDRNDTLNRLRFVRDEYGFGGDVTLEANGAWTADEALVILDQAVPFGIAGVEQPTEKDDLKGMQRVKWETGIPLIADESMCSLSEARRLIEEQACDIINIKISKCGGLLQSMAIARYAHAAGIPCQIGAHVGETEILSSAGRALARTVPEILRYDGFSSLLFDHHGGHARNTDCNAPHSGRDMAGLGMDVQDRYLVKLWSSDGATRQVRPAPAHL